jgi:hypothetical protein
VSKLTDKKFSEVMDMSKEEFETFLKECNPNLGEVMTLKKLLTLTYEEMNRKRIALMDKFAKSDNESEKKEIDSTVAGLFKFMLSTEHKCCVLTELAMKLMKDAPFIAGVLNK